MYQFTANKRQSQILNMRSLIPEAMHALNHHVPQSSQAGLLLPITTYFTSNKFQT